MHRIFFSTGALFAGLAVAMGAATGHETSPLGEQAQIWVEKATRYQFLHGLALLLVAIASHTWQEQRTLFNIAGWAFIVGTLCFSGSLYVMTFTQYSAGYVTPLGGTAYLAGWLAAVIAGTRLAPRLY